MSGLNASDIVQVTMEGRVNGQTCLTTFHYQCLVATSTPTYITAIQDFANGFDNGVLSPGLTLLDCMAENYTWIRTRAQRIYPTRDIYVTSTVDLPGTREGNATTPNIAAVITKRGPLAGRKYIGSTHIPAMSVDDYADGLVSTALKLKMELAAAKYLLVYVPAVGDGDFRQVIFNKATPGLSLGIQATTVQPQVRTMRRRTVGLGI